MWNRSIIVVGLWFWGLPFHVAAEREPLPTEALWQTCDAVVIVDVISVTNIGPHPQQGTECYIARFRVKESKKGLLQTGRLLQ